MEPKDPLEVVLEHLTPVESKTSNVLDAIMATLDTRSAGRRATLRGNLTQSEETNKEKLPHFLRTAYHKSRTEKYAKIMSYHGQLIRQAYLILQENNCYLCNQLITENASIDHSHTTGMVRGVMHQQCNILVGYVEKVSEKNNVSNEITLKKLWTLLCGKNDTLDRGGA